MRKIIDVLTSYPGKLKAMKRIERFDGTEVIERWLNRFELEIERDEFTTM